MKTKTMAGIKGRSGRLKNTDTVKVTTTVERKIRDKAKKNHGTYSNALRFAAENKPNVPTNINQ